MKCKGCGGKTTIHPALNMIIWAAALFVVVLIGTVAFGVIIGVIQQGGL